MSSSVTPREVLAWMAENKASSAEAGVKFGLPVAQVRRWKRKGVEGAAEPDPPPPLNRTSARARLALVGSAFDPEPDPDATEEELIRAAIRARLVWLAHPDSVGDKNQRDAAIVVGILLDKRVDLVSAATGEGDPADLTTAEGQEAAADALGALPRAVVQKLTAS